MYRLLVIVIILFYGCSNDNSDDEFFETVTPLSSITLSAEERDNYINENIGDSINPDKLQLKIELITNDQDLIDYGFSPKFIGTLSSLTVRTDGNNSSTQFFYSKDQDENSLYLTIDEFIEEQSQYSYLQFKDNTILLVLNNYDPIYQEESKFIKESGEYTFTVDLELTSGESFTAQSTCLITANNENY